MSTFHEILLQMGHACLNKAADPRVALADRAPDTPRCEAQFMALRGDLLLEIATELDRLFCDAAEQTLSGDWIDGQHHFDGSEVGIIAATVDDYLVAPIHAAIGEWEMAR